jgi:two-component system response regulator TctD
MRFLLIEDNPRLRELLTENIHAAGWRIDAFAAAQDGEEAIATTPFDLLLIDLGLPDGDGLDLIREARRRGVKTPILILTARGAVDERIAGLDAGADDYLVKPFDQREFLARCRALLRRAPDTAPAVLEAGLLRFDPASGKLSCGEIELALTPRERAIVEMLMRDLGRVSPKRKLEHALSEFGDELSTNALDLAMSRLRKKLDGLPTGVSIETIRGVGYLLREVEP